MPNVDLTLAIHSVEKESPAQAEPGFPAIQPEIQPPVVWVNASTDLLRSPVPATDFIPSQATSGPELDAEKADSLETGYSAALDFRVVKI